MSRPFLVSTALIAALSPVAVLLGTRRESASAQERGKGIPSVWDRERDGLDMFPLIDFGKKRETEPDTPADPIADRAVEDLRRRIAEAVERMQWKAAEELMDELLGEQGEHPGAPEIYREYVSRLAAVDEQKSAALDRAKDLMRRYPSEVYFGYDVIRNLTDSYLSFANEGALRPAAKVVVPIRGRNPERLELAVYRVDLFDLIERGIGIRAPHPPEGAEPLARWTHDVEARRRWFYERVEVPVEEPGAYIVTATTAHYELSTLVCISELAVGVSTDDHLLLVWAGTADGGKPAGACEIAVLDGTRLLHRGAMNAGGVFAARIRGTPERPLVVVHRGDHWAVSEMGTGAYRDGLGLIHAYTDRSVYRPAQTVHMKVIARGPNAENGLLEAAEGEVTVIVRDPRWNEVHKETVELSDFGTVELEWTLGEEPPLGHYYVSVSGARTFGYYFGFRVEEYKKPEYSRPGCLPVSPP